MKKFLLALAISLSMVGNVETAELYEVNHREVSYFNPNDGESVWITQAILYASSEYQVDPILIMAVMEAESGFDFKSTSPVGAIGLMQLMPETANAIGVNPYNPLEIYSATRFICGTNLTDSRITENMQSQTQ